MGGDFYCDEVLSGNVAINKVMETKSVLAYHHTNPKWPVHIVIIPKFHVNSLIELIHDHRYVLVEAFEVIAAVVNKVQQEHGGCRLTTNFGRFQTSKHLHWHVFVGGDF